MLQPQTWLARSVQLDWSLSFALHDHCPSQNLIAMSNVTDMQVDEVAATKLAVDRQVKQCEVTNVMSILEMYSNGPDVLWLQRGLLADQLAFVPGFSVLGGFHFRLLCC